LSFFVPGLLFFIVARRFLCAVLIIGQHTRWIGLP
jgi:hypothetical protein